MARKKGIRYSLSTKIASMVISAALIVFGGILTFIVINTQRTSSENAIQLATSIAKSTSLSIKGMLENNFNQVISSAQSLMAIKEVPESAREAYIDKTIHSLMAAQQENNTGVFGVFVDFEPYTIVSSRPDASVYYYLDNGKLVSEVYDPGDLDYLEEDYYRNTKDRNAPTISEIYEYTFEDPGKSPEWMVTITYPLHDRDGNYFGLIGYDILLSTMSRDVAEISSAYKTQYSYILSPGQYFAANSHDSSMVGKTFDMSLSSSDDRGLVDTARQRMVSGQEYTFELSSAVSGGRALKIHVPMHIGSVSDVWTAGISIDMAEIEAGTIALRWTVILFGSAGILLIALLVIFILKRAIRPVLQIAEASESLSKGNFDIRINARGGDEVGYAAQSFNALSESLRSYIGEISRILGEMSGGHMRERPRLEYPGSFSAIRDALGGIAENMNIKLLEIDASTQNISDVAGQVSSSSQLLSDGATRQAESIRELSASISSVSARVSENSENSKNASLLVGTARENAAMGDTHMKDMLSAMREIGESSQNVSKINKVIEDISFQTNILALNAAVEAARAGAAGKGFAVVAEEVRNLATRSAEAVKDTNRLISETIKKIDHGGKIANETAEALFGIVSAIDTLAGLSHSISTASDEQSAALEQINIGIAQISSVVQSNTSTASQTAATSEELSQLVERLESLIGTFDLERDVGQRPPDHSERLMLG